jgi:uncharacterized GH25 family protein
MNRGGKKMQSALLLAGVLAVAVAGTPRPTLRGVVLDSAGQPISAARVGLATAAPKTGPAIFCPSCYLDCSKFTTTDAQGQFEIPNLDPTLKFRVLCTAPGKKTTISPLYDPGSGSLELKLQETPRVPPEQVVRGQLVNAQGLPIAGALIEPSGAKTADKRWWGKVDVDPAASDKNGQFEIALPSEYEGIDVSVSADGYAGADVVLLKTGAEVKQLVIPRGTQVVGQLSHDGQPLANQLVAVAQIDRGMGHHFIKAVQAVTDSEGRFSFNHLPAAEAYAIFSPVGPGPMPMVLTTKRFTALADEQMRDLGTLDVVSALRLHGQLELPEGQSAPAHAKLSVERDPAWDLVSVDIQEDGRFEIEGLPPEVYQLRLVTPGMEIDSSHLNYQSTGPNQFAIALKDSLDDLEIPMHKIVQK